MKYSHYYSGELIVVKELPKIYHKDKCETIKGKTVIGSLPNLYTSLIASLRPCNSCNPPTPSSEDKEKYSQFLQEKEKIAKKKLVEESHFEKLKQERLTNMKN